jgi:hypothetical protein
MAILVNLNEIFLDGSSTPILVNLDKVCLIRTALMPYQGNGFVERAELIFDPPQRKVENNPAAIFTVETQREIYLLALSFIELWEKTSDGY